MALENLFYAFLGNNIIIGHHIKEQLRFLREILPEDFKEREIHDLGCGDGKVTIYLKEIFEAKHCYGFDVNERLVSLACKRGIEAKTLDLEKEVPRGELAVIWGVLHHLKSPRKVLKEIKNNYQRAFIREPLKGGLTLLELGKPFEEEVIKRYLRESFENYKSYIYKNAIFIFWKKF